MRVLLLNWRDLRHPQAGGAEVHVWEVFRRAAARGWDVTALACRFPGCTDEEVVEGIRVLRRGGEYSYNLSLPWAYRQVARQFRPDLVVEFMNKVPLHAPLYVRRPLVTFVHHLFGAAASMELPRIQAAIVQAFEGPVARVYRRTPVLTGSQSSAEELLALGLPREGVTVLPYGVDAAAYGPGAKAAAPTLLYAGRLKRYKGVDHLLDAVPGLARRFPALRVDIVGQGDARDALQAQAERLGIAARVRFHGHVSHEVKVRLFQEAWAMAFPSFKEGFGLTVAETALCGTPTVGYNVAGLCDAIQNVATGLLVPYGDREALEAALGRVLDDAVFRERLSTNALALYRDFTWERSADRFLAVLESVVEGKSEAAAVASEEL